jgi:lauroyl/myristoyl acyltransferase
MDRNSKIAARLLEVLLVFSAGLCRTWERSAIVGAYPLLAEFQKIYRRIDRQLLHSRETFPILNIERLLALLGQYTPRELVIATAHHGHFIAFMNACSHYGIPVAVCYKAASLSYIDAAKRNGLKLIDLNRQRNPLSLFHILDRERAKGRYVAIMMDGPFGSRRRYDFLGYRVAASSLAAVYARKSHSALLPLISSASADLELSFAEGPIIETIGVGTAQQLLDFLQSIILRQPLQHRWLSTSILMSDQTARENAIRFFPEALAWRESHSSVHFTMPAPLATLFNVTMSF